MGSEMCIRDRNLKRDYHTSLATLARAVKVHRPQLIIADGQGALIALGLAKALVVESCLSLRNADISEAIGIARAWGAVRGIVVSQPRIGRAMLDVSKLQQAVPELFTADHPWEGPP